MECSECGHKNPKNANFCSKCGKSFNSNEDKNSNDEIKKSLNDVKEIFKHPIDKAKEFIKEENYLKSLIYLSINIIIFALLVIVVIKTMYSQILDLNYYNNFYYNFNNLVTDVSISYLKIFLIAVISGALFNALFAGIIYLVNTYLFRSKTNFEKIITWLGYNSILLTVSSIVVLFATFISFKLGIFLAIITMILYIYNLFRSVEYITDLNINKLGYLLLTSIVITFLIVYIVFPIIFF